jgi:hypothetical protein
MAGSSSRTAVALAIATSLAAGCSGTKHYLAARGLDLWDVLPVSVQTNFFQLEEVPMMPGAPEASVRITPLFQTGLGGHGAKSYGMALGRWGPVWTEMGIHAVIISMEGHEINRSDNWPGGPDQRYLGEPEEGKLGRGQANLLGFIPIMPGFHPPPDSPILPRWYAWADSDVHVFAGFVGLRLGFSPAQAVDFLCGLLGFDPLGDDPPATCDRPPPEHEPEPIRG